MIFTANPDSIRVTDGFLKNAIMDSGVYVGTIKLAKYVVSSGGTSGIRFLFESDEDGKTAVFTLYTHKSGGRVTKAFYLLNDMMIVLGIKQVLPKTIKVEEFDKRRKRLVEVDRTCYTDFHERKIILEFGARKTYPSDRYPVINYSLVGIFNAETKQSAEEMIKNIPSITFVAK